MTYIIIWDFGYRGAWMHTDMEGFVQEFDTHEDAVAEAKENLDGEIYSNFTIATIGVEP